MKQVNISYLRNHLSAILAKLNSYGSVCVMDRNAPVALLLPASSLSDAKDENRLRALARKGVIIHQTAALNPAILAEDPPHPSQAVNAVKLLLEERSSTR